MANVAIVSCNDNYDYGTRTKYVKEYFENLGYNVCYIIADFDHRSKKKYCASRNDDIKYINVRQYKKNISLGRIFSHIQFANGVYNILKEEKFDIVYHCAPPNLTIKKIAKLKKKMNFYLISEIGDMWPETMPVSNAIKKILFIPFKIWRNFRKNYLFNSNVVVAECDLFKNQIIKQSKIGNVHTMYFCKKSDFITIPNYDNNQLNLCYLGSINNIIDLELIKIFSIKLSKFAKIHFDIIGEGEKRDEMIKTLQDVGCDVTFHGIIFDNNQKKNIFSKCNFALNIMKDSVYVGMTMKSLDYFSYGLPIINNINGDISKLVESENLGFNVDKDNIMDVVNRVINLKLDDYLIICENVRKAHEKYFDTFVFEKKMNEIMKGYNSK